MKLIRLLLTRHLTLSLLLVCMSPVALAQAWLGVEIEPVPTNTANVHNLPHGTGAHIAAVVPHGPADRAGLQSGDIILHLNYQEIHGPASVVGLTRKLEPGRAVPVGIMRYGKRMLVYVLPRPKSDRPDH